MEPPPPVVDAEPRSPRSNRQEREIPLWIKWLIVLTAGLIVLLLPVPEGITVDSWRLLAIFIATLVGSIVRPVPVGGMVLLGISAIILTRVMPVDPAIVGTRNIETVRIKEALGG